MPAAAVLYGSIASGTGRPGDCYPIEEAARFSLLDLSMHLAARTTSWCGTPTSPLQTLRGLNPTSTVLLYRMSPIELNWVGGRYPVSGREVYERLRQSNGIGSSDPWFAAGYRTGDYLVDMSYPQYVAMELGNANWRRYWIEQGWQEMWGASPVIDARGASGVFVDGMPTTPYSNFPMCPMSQWDSNRRTCNSQQDHASTYWAGSTWNSSLWVTHLFDFIREAVPWYRARGLTMMFNSWMLRPDYVQLLNQVGGHAMEECSFVCPERGLNTTHWLQRLDILRSAQNFAVLSTNRINVSGSGLARMDAAVYGNLRGWDLLWFAMTSFLLGYDPERRNGYFHFTAWGYRDSYWFDEYDPRYLNLGRPVTPARQLSSGAWEREFERGWVWVNPGPDAKTINVPRGRARILNHDNFKTPSGVSPVNQFTLQGWTGVIGIKE